MQLLKKDLKYKPRKEQQEALDFIKNEFETNKTTKFFMLDLPTGIGKSYLAFLTIDYILKNKNKKANFDIITNSKLLQEQYTQDFDSLSNLWGKNNYQCTMYEDCSCKEGKEFSVINKTKCEECPYDQARESYIKSRINLSNFHLFTLLNIYSEDMMEQRHSNILFVDEAHSLESVVSDFISISFSGTILKSLGFKNSKAISQTIKSVNSIEDFVDFSVNFKNQLESTKNSMKLEIVTKNGKSDISTLMKRFSELESMETKLDNFLDDYEKRPENWILEYSFNDKKEKKIVIQPIWAAPYLEEYIWSKYDYVFLMSGTILNKELFSYINGIPPALAAYYTIDSPFDHNTRPIYYMPVSRMTFKNKEGAFKNYKPFINKIMSKYKNKKGIFHTTTYEIANWMEENFKDNERLLFHTPDTKDKCLKKHYMLEETPTVLVSPSMGTGINLEYDRARFQVLLKIPYPSLGSTKNKRRMQMNKDWYTYLTISSVIQAYGRGIRHYDDQCDFIILDACFSDIMKYSSQWIPSYMSDALRTVDMSKLKRQANA
jgi:ATP-dependent DNA helicase DinG